MVANVISSTNPMMLCQWYKNAGTTTAPGGLVTDVYTGPTGITCQVQQLTTADRKTMNDMSVSGITRKIWCDAILTGVDRAAGVGGDRVYLPDGTIWLVVAVPEVWLDWCSALLQKQVS